MTKNVRVGCLVFCTLFRNPGLLAKAGSQSIISLVVEQTLVSEQDGLKKSFVSSVMGFRRLASVSRNWKKR